MDRLYGLAIRVQPRASRNAIEFDGERSDMKITVRVTAAPEGGKANDAVVALLAKRLRVPKSSVRIVRGHKSRDKRISIEGVSAAEALKALRSDSSGPPRLHPSGRTTYSADKP